MAKRIIAVLGLVAVAMIGHQQLVMAASEFVSVNIRLEQNVTDGDGEAIVTANAGTGLKWFSVIAPDGDRVVNLSSKGNPRLGQSQIQVETPEPAIEKVKAAYPEGTYKFVGLTVDCQIVTGAATLSHIMSEAPSITSPLDKAANVPIDGLTVTWEPVVGVTGYFIELAQEALGIVLKSDLLSTSTSFALPSGWVLPDREYVLGVMAIGANGNRSGTEITFHTAK